MITSLKVFFNAYEYLTDCLSESLRQIDKERLKEIFRILIHGRDNGSKIIVDGQGRSLQSMLIMEDCLEHNGFPIIFPASNANLRPWKKGDIFFFNSGSGSGAPLRHAQYAKKDELDVLGMTYNVDIHKEFPKPLKGILILAPSTNKNKLYAPLGTEFEFTSAVIGASLGYSVGKNPEESLVKFEECCSTFLKLFRETYTYYENNLDALIKFINLIDEYVDPSNESNVFFRGVGRDSIINQVAAIRFGHLHKKVDDKVIKDLRVIFEGHWGLRSKGDLSIITSGSGSTSQTLNYATQSFVSGLNVFGITSFKDSDLGKFTERVDGCLVVPGRHDPFSMYNLVSRKRKDYLPEFELNVYLTMDSLLAQVACDHGITEDDMRASHRMKELES
ncbi:MAG: hypothetical protein GF364_20845 [Candidatus Lokiarchaeota archaeon]|nr:hypothetical protein [Candidatus Lokiarchaeota archaeon]